MKRIKPSGVVSIVAIALFTAVGRVWAGTLDAPAEPGSTNSAMFTLEDIYRKVNAQGADVGQRTGGFAEPASGPTGGTMHTLNDIMALVTTRAPVPKTGQTATAPYNPAPAGSDGTYRTGVDWPTPRFTVGTGVASNCVTDNLTGLMWIRNPDAVSRVWADAEAFCEALDGADGRGGHTDWRLPNIRELHSLVDFRYSNPSLPDTTGTARWTEGEPFIGMHADANWSSSISARFLDRALYVNFGDGTISALSRTSTPIWTWPVRGGR